MPLTEKITITRSKHTVDGEYDFALSIERAGKLLVVAETFGRLSESVASPAKAYAELFAAAPELLDTLKVIASLDGSGNLSMGDQVFVVTSARNAIAKATGT